MAIATGMKIMGETMRNADENKMSNERFMARFRGMFSGLCRNVSTGIAPRV